MTNRLIHEKSPYLLQHAHNPVDWYPWGDEAFTKARKENRPILLSVGYSTCHWCHVMERESFSDPQVAELMNAHFVCIKLDREERPDLDQIYITAVSSLTGSAGWPLNIFLTPDLKPFFGGTYFPPDPRPGMISWPNLLNLLSKAWSDPLRHHKILDSAEDVVRGLKGMADGPEPSSHFDPEILDKTLDAFEKIHDNIRGGFSKAPKFPSPSILSFLMFYHTRSSGSAGKRGEHAMEMALKTLTAMASGGIYDQIGGGFHRYSTDAQWHLPHFEKMLYDNAQLIGNYVEAFRITADPFYREIAEESIEYVLREMTHSKGGFFSAEDADSYPERPDSPFRVDHSQKEEGAFYAWRYQEIEAISGKENAEIIAYRYGATRDGNVKTDPYGEFDGKNILFRQKSIEQTAEKFNMPAAGIREILDRAKRQLLNARSQRPRPHLDDKIITEWNALMVSALARSYPVLGEKRYLEAGQKCMEFILSSLYDSEKKRLYRIWRENERRIEALAPDYAFLIQALVDLYESDFNSRWLDHATELSDILIQEFYDKTRYGFFTNIHASTENLIVRFKETHDNVIPSSGSVAVNALFRLAEHTGRIDFAALARQTFMSFIKTMENYPGSSPLMLLTIRYVSNREGDLSGDLLNQKDKIHG
ncbi:MAG: thioredoxin domain-containing protein [Thermodesulfobacteriota bacterium]